MRPELSPDAGNLAWLPSRGGTGGSTFAYFLDFFVTNSSFRDISRPYSNFASTSGF